MPSYTTAAAVRTAGGFTNTTNITTATIEAYILDVGSVIDAKIGDAYLLPLPEVPEIIEMIARNLTKTLLYMNEYGEESQDSDKGWEKLMKWCMDMLEDIRTQKLKLTYNTGSSTGTPGAEMPRSSLRQPNFYPTAASSDPSSTDPTNPKLTINQQF